MRSTRAIVRATTHYADPDEVLKQCEKLGDAMPGIEMSTLGEDEKLQTRGW